jgi:endonuclease YncB( thermonuclease family)
MNTSRVPQRLIRYRLLVWGFVLSLLGAPAAGSGAAVWTGRVVGVADGDTLTVLHDGRGEKIRLYGIDTPEKHQDFGRSAKEFTAQMVFGKAVTVEAVAVDRYGRTVACVSVDGLCLNEALVRSGYAWVYRSFCRSSRCAGWQQAEQAARESRIGLWSMPGPVPPWEYRRAARRRPVAP